MHGADKVWRAMGRRGAPALVDVLANRPGPWTLRALARATGVPLATVRRVLDDLQALGCIERLRPGRDAQVTWREGPIADWLTEMPPLDWEAEVLAEFSAAYGPGELRTWQHPDDDGPQAPVRIVIFSSHEDQALDRIGPALDALELAGWPAPEVTVEDPEALDPTDRVAAAMLQPKT